jgi:Protein of unknown function (DUF4230)
MTSTGDDGVIREKTAELPEYARGQARPAETRPESDDDEPSRPFVIMQQARGRGCLFSLIGIVAAILALVFGLRLAGVLPSFDNPFSQEKTDRTGPAVLKSIQDLSRFTAAQGNFQVVVDLQNDRKYVPDFLLNHRTLFVGVGSVEAYVDFSTIGQGAVVESADRKSVEIKLPAPQLGEANLDVGKSYVFAEERGLFNRIKDAFSGDPNRQQETYKRAQDAITQAARDTELLQRAQENTRKMLEGLLRSLGYQTITITFAAS